MTALLGLWRLFFFVDFLNDAYFLYYVFSGKCLYDGLIRAMTLIVFLQISPYDAYYVYDAYSGVESNPQESKPDIRQDRSILSALMSCYAQV